MQEADFNFTSSANQMVAHFEPSNISLYLKREDLIDLFVSGNKFRKLKYNISKALEINSTTLLTFGGAYSNHIAATAAAGKKYGLKTIGIIRGDELGNDLEKTLATNETLKYAAAHGMQFHFISRDRYKRKEEPDFIKNLKNQFGDFYFLPEGGTNPLAIKGCEEILTEEDKDFNYICSSVGTGGTIAGIINASKPDQYILGFPALKGDWLSTEIKKYTTKNNWRLITDYHFGGYAKVNSELIYFINLFRKKYEIALDPVYTGKMLYGIIDMIENSKFPQNSRILAIHTGGLQGIAGMNELLTKKNLLLIDV
ncbi:1-aminocyclopropane-1-carboxylate deaminase/D-cysteine desulfhydrase [Gillisia sp. Hel_I_86]|uniref:1-aminocyclopropane-1-carboxylate deaminase/D-cysteine desulfhydrase n=1 Tax=Gillisia sp. Hel_I_86 TaxID=1249981 RepID=UPI0011A5B75D|nr:pyridoxal-phosphate dependent enzyme [Gillisia sp. Hel_I_86]